MMLDAPVFKRLAHNDTGAATGHQAGIVIPKEIAPFFPPLPPVTTTTGPTVDVPIAADLFVDGKQVAFVMTRYQHQTWGGTRRPERRITDNLGPLRNSASKDDIVVFSKDLDQDGYLRIHLVRQGTEEYRSLDRCVGSRRWGLLDPANPPVSVEEIRDAEAYLEDTASRAPAAFGPERAFSESRTARRARDRAFRRKILEQYRYRCAFTGRRLASPFSNSVVGIDAAHVVPVHARGTDHPANGIALSKDMHWAFDMGLLSIADDRTIIVPDSVASMPGNEFLRDLYGKRMAEAVSSQMRVLNDAFFWHRVHVLIK